MFDPLKSFNEMTPELSALSRQQKMADLLTAKGLQSPQGQTINGVYVPTNPFEFAGNLYSLYAGKQMGENIEQKQLDLAKALRQKYTDEITQYQNLIQGRPEMVQQAGPMPDGGNIPAQMIRGTPDPQSAYLFASSATNPALQAVGLKKLTEGPKYKEMTLVDPETGNKIAGLYDENSANPKSTWTPMGVSSEAIGRAELLRLRDDGIVVPQQSTGLTNPMMGQAAPVGPYGANVQFNPNQVVGTPQNQPSGQPQVTPNVAPTVASSKEYNPFIAPPVPAGLSGRQARDWKADQAKPLTGESEKQVSGAINYQKSLDNLQDIFQKYKGADLLKPNVRAEIQQSLNNALLQGKEANRLGVLNGPDLSILEKIVGDPTSIDALVKDRATLNKLYNNQRMFTAEVIKTNYRSSQKAVPENLREFVEIKPRELSSEKPKDGNADIQSQLRSKGIPYQPKLYEYRVNPDGSVDRKRKIL